jgi:hypothetical protein
VSDNGGNAAIGLGIEYMFNETIGVRGEWERFLNVGNDSSTGKTSIDMFSVSALLRF